MSARWVAWHDVTQHPIAETLELHPHLLLHITVRSCRENIHIAQHVQYVVLRQPLLIQKQLTRYP